MGLLSIGSPLEWKEAKKYADHVRKNGVEQLINTFNRIRDYQNDYLQWGDEVEYVMMEMDSLTRQYRLSPRAEDVLDLLRAEMRENHHKMDTICYPDTITTNTKTNGFTATWHPEYGKYMLESTPAHPYRIDVKDLLCVEKNMILRRRQVKALLYENEKVLTIGNFPRLGCPDAFDNINPSLLNNEASKSLFFPDQYINSHARFKTLTRNIRERRGSKVNIELPIFQDEHTEKVVLNKQSALFVEGGKIDTVDGGYDENSSDKILLDAMGLGMGCCCLQITFQARNISEARRLYDQLAIICPIMLALTASTPIYRGILSDVDCRWDVISASVDDRTPMEREVIPKSRYASISRYLSQDSRMKDESYNDLKLSYNECCYGKLIDAGFDHLLARHFSWLFTRDPLVIYRELLEQNNETSSDHFENIQSTNWQTMRFKPPPPESPQTGWRVEFRPMEVQITDFENAALAVFTVLLTRAVLAFDLNFYMPISLIDKNMDIAQKRDALLQGLFHWRTGSHDDFPKVSANVIFNGCPTNGYIGLVGIVEKYLDTLEIDPFIKRQLGEYIELVRLRAQGIVLSPASWMRNFVCSHSEYKKDSIVTPSITFDMINEIDKITNQSIGFSTVDQCCSYSYVV